MPAEVPIDRFHNWSRDQIVAEVELHIERIRRLQELADQLGVTVEELRFWRSKIASREPHYSNATERQIDHLMAMTREERARFDDIDGRIHRGVRIIDRRILAPNGARSKRWDQY